MIWCGFAAVNFPAALSGFVVFLQSNESSSDKDNMKYIQVSSVKQSICNAWWHQKSPRDQSAVSQALHRQALVSYIHFFNIVAQHKGTIHFCHSSLLSTEYL